MLGWDVVVLLSRATDSGGPKFLFPNDSCASSFLRLRSLDRLPSPQRGRGAEGSRYSLLIQSRTRLWVRLGRIRSMSVARL